MPKLVIDIAKYIYDRYPPAQNWTWPIALGWVNWNFGMGYLAVAMESPESKKILGVAVCRPVTIPGDGAVAYRHDENGTCLFVDLWVSDSKASARMLTAAFKHRFGERKKVAYFRGTEKCLRIRDHSLLVRNGMRGPELPLVIEGGN